MSWDAAPTGRRGRQQTDSDVALQACLSMTVLFCMALRQSTGVVESLLQLVGFDWTVPDVSTLSRRQKTLAVNIPYRGSKEPLHLPIYSTGIKVEGEGEWHARKLGGPKRRVWRKIHLGIDEETLEVRAMEITASHMGPSRQHAEHAPAGQWMRRCDPTCSNRSRRTSRSAASPPTVARTLAKATIPSLTAASTRSDTLSNRGRSCLHSAPQERQTVEDSHRRRGRTKRSTA